MRIVTVADTGGNHVILQYKERLQTLEAIYLDMVRDDNENGLIPPGVDKVTYGMLLTYCCIKCGEIAEES